MLALVSMALGILLGRLRGGSLRRLGEAPFRGLVLIYTGLAVQAAVRLLPADLTRHLGPLLPFLYRATLVMGLLFIWSNRRLGPATRFIFTGVAANLAVIAANGGRMPVLVAAARNLGYDRLVQVLQAGTSLTHQALIPGATKLALLADVFSLPALRFAGVFSIGDIILVPGVVWLTVQLMGGCSRPSKVLE